MVFDAWKRVKANRGAAGIDAETIAEFEANLANNLYALWNRRASGSYLPPPVKEVPIPKHDGGIRLLGVPTVADRVAQTVISATWNPFSIRYSTTIPMAIGQGDLRRTRSG